MIYKKIDIGYLKAISELIRYYQKYKGNKTENIIEYGIYNKSMCPLCTVAGDYGCVDCPWVKIEGKACFVLKYSEDSATKRIERLNKWLQIIRKQQAGGKTL